MTINVGADESIRGKSIGIHTCTENNTAEFIQDISKLCNEKKKMDVICKEWIHKETIRIIFLISVQLYLAKMTTL
jgi:hypothetical protein